MEVSKVSVSREGRVRCVAVLRMSFGAKAGNLFNPKFIAAFHKALDQIEQDPECHNEQTTTTTTTTTTTNKKNNNDDNK